MGHGRCAGARLQSQSVDESTAEKHSTERGARLLWQSMGWSGNKKHQIFFPQNFRENIREFCVRQFSRVQTCTKAPLPSPPLKPHVKQFGQHVWPLKCHQGNCPRHLCASYCIGCSVARVVRQQVTVQILFKYLQYLEYSNVERGPGNRAGCFHQKKCIWFCIPAGKYISSWAEVLQDWWWIYVEQLHVFVELLHLIAVLYILLCRTVLVHSCRTVNLPTCSLLIAIALQR